MFILNFLIFRSPYAYMLRLTKIVGTIFGTGSSAATLPVSMNCLEQVATVYFSAKVA